MSFSSESVPQLGSCVVACSHEPLAVAVIFVAGVAAGMINSVAGGGTLLSFPALLWLGRDPIIANATNAVALWPGSFAGTVGYRKELQGTRRWILLLCVPALLGGTFGAVVPYLILLATTLVAVQEPIAKRLGRLNTARDTRSWWIGAMIFQFVVSIYGGYFGAGMGILMLAALGFLGLTDIHQLNGIKSVLALAINFVAAIYFAISGAVVWTDALLMALGAIAGGYGGAGLARRLGRQTVRRLVVSIGLVMAISLFLRQL